MAILEAQNIEKRFGQGSKEIVALHDISLKINDGEFVAIVGPSGCGKTTFLHILGGFVPKSSGSVTVDGLQVNSPGPDRGMMFQDFALYPWRTVIGNVAWGLEVQGTPKKEREAIAEKYLSMVGLTAFRKHYPGQLSGGMKQRVALARVLAFEPGVLLMDEPFGALDVQTRELMQEELASIHQQTGKTVLFITHDIEEAVYLADRVIVFTARPGRIKDVLTIDLPRPRQIELKKTGEFLHYRNLIWDLLREEVLKAHYDQERSA